MNFIDKNVSVEQTIILLAKNGIKVNEKEAEIILELLYLISKNYNKPKEKRYKNLNWISNKASIPMKSLIEHF